MGRRFIIVERGDEGCALDSGVYMPQSEPMTPEVAVERVHFWALGQIDDTFEEVGRDDPGADYEVFVPPEDLPRVGQPGRDGESRPEVIADVIGRCDYVATVRRRARTDWQE